MGSLKTYEREWSDGGPPEGDPWPVIQVDGCGDQTCCPLAPGSFVTSLRRGGFGMVIAVDGEQLVVLWSEDPTPPSIADLVLPKIRHRVDTMAVAQELIKVQPMTMPAGGVFYLDYTYGSGSMGSDPKDECMV